MSIRAHLFAWYVLCGFVMAADVVFPSPARAAEVGPTEADKVEARKHFDQGRRLFDLQHYMESVPEFESAYRLSGDPAFLYNIAQSYRLADRPSEATHYYNTFLKRDPNTPRRAEVERRLKELESAKAPPNQVTEPSGKAGEAATENALPSQPSPPPLTPAPSALPTGSDVTRPQPVMIPPGSKRFSQGLFIQGELGIGLVSAKSSSADVTISGAGAILSLRVGSFVLPGVAVFGQVTSAAVTNPTVDFGSSSTTASGTLDITGLGGGAIYYSPSNWFGSIGGLFQKISWDRQVDGASSKIGFAVSLSAGHEWSVNERLSWGLVAQLLAGGVPEDNGGSGSWTTVAIGFGGVLSFN